MKRFSLSKKYYPELLVLVISLLAYGMTVSPTVNFWDCGEFIAAASGLEVPHPPGAPVYLLLARVFSLIAPGTEEIAYWINILSVVASAFTVFFLYKILCILFGMINSRHDYPYKKFVGVFSAATGSLLFAFTDTFWHSAVEAEVYALSLFFSAATLWVFLSWYVRPGNDPRWFFLGIYLLGLSMGVHLLNLLLVPVFVVLFGWKQFGHRIRSTLVSLTSGFLLLGFLLWGLVTNGLWPAMKLELLLVNSLDMPKHSGLIGWIFFLVVAHISGIAFSYRKHSIVHFAFVVSALLLIGWGSYALVPIRAEAHPPINMNAPGNVFSLSDYINRTQYGSRPLIYGVHGGAVADDWDNAHQFYFQSDKKRYKKITSGTKIKYSSDDYVWFPRMHSHQELHSGGYKWWTGLDPSEEKPRLFHQVKFFLRYQLGHNYLRYLMWNFAGRQNDQQGHGDIYSGNWASGIDIIDRNFLGSRVHSMAQETYSPAANYYFGIPLLLALIGILFLMRQGYGRKKVLFLITLLFLMTGPAIVFYLNQPPYEPRERDYVFVASFMSIAMFAAFGIYGLLRKVVLFSDSKLTSVLAAVLLFVAGPVLLFSVNLNDHDRSQRYLARDLSVSQLRSCPPGAILFTYGDNDTYPLWYAQQVEGVRRDVRLVNTGLLNVHWYVRQVLQAGPGSPGLKMHLPFDFYLQNTSDFFGVSNIPSAPLTGKEALKRIISEEGGGEIQKGSNRNNLHPVWEISLHNKDSIRWNIRSLYLSAGDLALADIIASNGKQRPVCFTRNVDQNTLRGWEDHFRPQGLVWILGHSGSMEMDDQRLIQRSYVFMNSISVGREGNAWWDNTCRQAMDVSGYRQTSIDLARNLLKRGMQDIASEVLIKSIEEWPYSPYSHQGRMLEFARLMEMCGERDEAARLVQSISHVNLENVFFHFYSGFDPEDIRRKYCGLFREIRSMATDLELEDVLLETEIKLNNMCDF